ncbi:hypothetical protein CDO52_01650 [Nocardiopsis gilva YIM 90087]|uniref:Xaa-Pro aminopeptidase n=2 Tax=Nocardiopsis gilva TaxID=280236 RepID=A0A223SCZ8_9ACTN|nr:hypothetical protein CDO52_01650 [Nocardiopsis gilva YIM 90087]
METDTLDTADITRTLPLSGHFSPLQRQVDKMVLAAQEAGMAALRPGGETLPVELWGIGARIKDDLVITADGAQLMSRALARAPEAIKTWTGVLLNG